MTLRSGLVVVAIVAHAACSSSKKSDQAFESDVVTSMHGLLLANVQALNQAAHDLQDAAPTPIGRGWDATDENAIASMKNAWTSMRKAWEASEGVIAPLFPDLDGSMDSRYDDLLAGLGAAGDPDLFDGQGVTGMHAVERILFAPLIPPEVVAEEAMLPGYVAAAWPATQDQAAEFKNGLCARLVTDSQSLVDRWKPQSIDLDQAFDGLTSLMNEQKEKVKLAATHQEESRYSQRTMGDLRDNLAGTRAAYDLFTPWLETKPGGIAINDQVESALDRLNQTYSTVYGDAIPMPPPTLDPTMPLTVPDQATPFGMLYIAVVQEVDPTYTGSAVDAMNHVATALGLPLFTGDGS
jgi:iron uptake system component EfeO